MSQSDFSKDFDILPRWTTTCAFLLWTFSHSILTDLSSSVSEPVWRSCHLYTAHRVASRQVSATLYPRKLPGLWFWCELRISIPHQWFTCVHLLHTHLIRSMADLFLSHSIPSCHQNSTV